MVPSGKRKRASCSEALRWAAGAAEPPLLPTGLVCNTYLPAASMRSSNASVVKRGPHVGEAVYGYHPSPLHVWSPERDARIKANLRALADARRQREEFRQSKEIGTLPHLRRKRGEWFDDQQRAADTCRVSLYVNGMGFRVERRLDGYSWSGGGDGAGGGKRGRIKGFSKASAARLRDKVWKLPKSCVPVMVTLTYPFLPSPEQAKRDLDAFCKALDRKYPKAAGVWKLEFTRKGVPHFHLLVWCAQPWKNWIARTWYRIVGSGDARHLAAGTRVEKLRSYRGTLAYVGKNYMTKIVASPAGNWGRFWGVFNAKGLPVSEVVEAMVPGRVGVWIARTVRRWMRAKSGGRCRHGGRGRVVWITTDHFKRWVDLLEFLEKLVASEPRHVGVQVCD